MKLKTKLKLSFIGMAMIPLVLISLCVCGLMYMQMNRINAYYGFKIVTMDTIANPIQIINELANFVEEDIESQLKADGGMLDDVEKMAVLDQKLKKGIKIVVRKNGEYIYSSSGLDLEKGNQMLPEYGMLRNDVIYHSGPQKCIIRQLDIEGEKGDQYSLTLLTYLNGISDRLQYFWLKMLITVIALLVMISGAMTTWIYRGTIIPLRKLSEAAQNISEGNLDFEIIPVGDQEIKGLGDDFELMRRRLKEAREDEVAADKQSRELIRNISHDLKTPITAIKGYVEGLQDGIADTEEKREKYLKTIYNKAIEMDRLIDELTLYSKIDTNKAVYHYDRLEVREFFEDCRDSLTAELGTKGVEFFYSNKVASNAEIIADAEQLSKVINNIISNSIKYQADRGLKIWLNVKDEGDFVRVEIEDNGIGIAKNDLPHIFERSYRADLSRSSATGGSGIGLAIVKTIIEDHGGKVWAESKEGEGTKMCFVLRKYLGGVNE